MIIGIFFYILAWFLFTSSETKLDYFNKKPSDELSYELPKNLSFWTLRNTEISGKPQN